jgi:hypothetical protein
MRRTVKWLGRMPYAGAIVGALAFGAQQAVAARHVSDPCVCPQPGQGGEQCDACCHPDAGWCSYYSYCICL